RCVLASSAIRCRRVDRFVRPKVLSHVSRQRFSPYGTPLSSIGSRRARFPDVIGTIEVLRRPVTHAQSLIGFASEAHAVLRASCLASALPDAWSSRPGQGPCSTGDPNEPVCSRVDVRGTSQVPRRPIPCLCPALRPRPNRRPLAFYGLVDAAPALPTAKASALVNFGALSRRLGIRCLRFTNDVATTHAKLASGRLA